MKKILSLIIVSMYCVPGLYAQNVIVDSNVILGIIKPMNAVNNGPVRAKKSQTWSNFEDFKALNIPYSRNHDASIDQSFGGAHTVDVKSIFPDFSADVNDPASYDFTCTDNYISTIVDSGAKVFYRLGEHIENTVKAYDVYPPADYLKWAKICEHIILHYTQGWADGYHYDIEYWEIWNEPDLDVEQYKVKPRTWGGSEADFHDFFEKVSKYLHRKFPQLKIGGPALCEREDWAERFLAEMQKRNVPMDFFSFHCYTSIPDRLVEKIGRISEMTRNYGYGDVELILNEWSYVENWSSRYVASLRAIQNERGAAFCAEVMNKSQLSDLDMLMYYDVRRSTVLNGFFAKTDAHPLKTYYTFYSWSKLAELGTQVKAVADDPEISVTAAKDGDGRLGLFVSRYCPDYNIVEPKIVTVSLTDGGLKDSFAYVTDLYKSYTEVPVVSENGKISIKLQPNSIAYIILR